MREKCHFSALCLNQFRSRRFRISPTMKRSSTRSLGNSHKRKADLWTDSDMSSEDDFVVPPMSSTFKPAAQEHYESIQTHCCLICSILPSLSQINCCSQHLSALTGTPLRPFVYIMHRDNDRSKRRAELWSPSSSSRSSSTTLGRQKTKRLINKPRPVRHRPRVSNWIIRIWSFFK